MIDSDSTARWRRRSRRATSDGRDARTTRSSGSTPTSRPRPQARHAPLHHLRIGGRRQEHAHRPDAPRHQADLRGPARVAEETDSKKTAPRAATSTSRSSSTGFGPSGSRASRSTSPTASSRPRSGSSSSPTRPGHEQYTRNMVTVASTADVAVILIDARQGVLTQTRRHSMICATSASRTWCSR